MRTSEVVFKNETYFGSHIGGRSIALLLKILTAFKISIVDSAS
jgi:hypothetical protein